MVTIWGTRRSRKIPTKPYVYRKKAQRFTSPLTSVLDLLAGEDSIAIAKRFIVLSWLSCLFLYLFLIRLLKVTKWHSSEWFICKNPDVQVKSWSKSPVSPQNPTNCRSPTQPWISANRGLAKAGKLKTQELNNQWQTHGTRNCVVRKDHSRFKLSRSLRSQHLNAKQQTLHGREELLPTQPKFAEVW